MIARARRSFFVYSRDPMAPLGLVGMKAMRATRAVRTVRKETTSEEEEPNRERERKTDSETPKDT